MALPQWCVLPGLADYAETLAAMEQRAFDIRAGNASEAIWLVEHPPVYTGGTSARADELLQPDRFPVMTTGRGGRYTYHGPGQRVVYVMLDLAARGRDVRRFVAALEHWVIDALADFGVESRIICGKVGVWVDGDTGPAKIAALGVRLRQWVSLHGLAINVAPDLEHFAGILPCGLHDPVTSLATLGRETTMNEIDSALQNRLGDMLRRTGIAP
ncbi:lipoyl(octanoyl) transferase LipB [Polymorphobacter multimanifer]|uniref:lipoyl(octanoyl) transferase LipB n=1 Tax=Polymorphobacter multimanifer TaxID=1070431 RepID=UPI00160AC73C|nr:lipoyl(octanoyl) transferase LipB [Polymorphobacter multimanifer]